jgi:predicted Zn-dependent protease with MMP-like domain
MMPSLDSDLPPALLEMAEDALQRGDPQAALTLCDQLLRDHPNHPDVQFLQAEAQRDLGDFEKSEELYREVVAQVPEHALAWSGLAWLCFETLKWEEARSSAARAIRLDPRNPEALWVRALTRERRGDEEGARRDFLRSHRIDPFHFPTPGRLSDALAQALVEEALRTLEPTVRAYLQQVPIILEEFPEEDILEQFDPPASPSELLGYFSGTPLPDRGLGDPWSQMPATIVLYRRNIERMFHDHDRLIEELRITIFHEVGHFLGLDEEDLEARGLD